VDGRQKLSASHVGVANLAAPQVIGCGPHHLRVKGRIAQLSLNIRRRCRVPVLNASETQLAAIDRRTGSGGEIELCSGGDLDFEFSATGCL